MSYQGVAFWGSLGENARVIFCEPGLKVNRVVARLDLATKELNTTVYASLPIPCTEPKLTNEVVSPPSLHRRTISSMRPSTEGS